MEDDMEGQIWFPISRKAANTLALVLDSLGDIISHARLLAPDIESGAAKAALENLGLRLFDAAHAPGSGICECSAPDGARTVDAKWGDGWPSSPACPGCGKELDR